MDLRMHSTGCRMYGNKNIVHLLPHVCTSGVCGILRKLTAPSQFLHQIQVEELTQKYFISAKLILLH
jgi:hypothetical protein